MRAARPFRHEPPALAHSFAGRTLILSRGGWGTQLDFGIAALHLSLGMGAQPHTLRWGEGGEIISLVAEDQA